MTIKRVLVQFADTERLKPLAEAAFFDPGETGDF